MKLAIVGSTELDEKQRLTALLLIQSIGEAFSAASKGDFIIVSGGAPGVDTLAEGEAGLNGWGTSIHYPKNKRWEPEGYKDRNILIAEECDILLRIATRESKTYGSGWTADYAEKQLGRQVYRVYV